MLFDLENDCKSCTKCSSVNVVHVQTTPEYQGPRKAMISMLRIWVLHFDSCVFSFRIFCMNFVANDCMGYQIRPQHESNRKQDQKMQISIVSYDPCAGSVTALAIGTFSKCTISFSLCRFSRFNRFIHLLMAHIDAPYKETLEKPLHSSRKPRQNSCNTKKYIFLSCNQGLHFLNELIASVEAPMCRHSFDNAILCELCISY